MDETRRAFTVEGVGELYLATPTADDVRSSDWQYSRCFSKALVEGLTTAGEMYDILRRRNVISDAQEKKTAALKEKIGKKIVDMELASEPEVRKALALEVSSLREELFRDSKRINGPLSNTAESVSEDQRLEYLTSCITQNLDGSRVWKDYDSYIHEPNRAKAWGARFETMIFLQGLDHDFLDKTPENIVLKELANLESEKKSQDGAIAKAEEIAKVEAATQPAVAPPEVLEDAKPKARRGRKKADKSDK